METTLNNNTNINVEGGTFISGTKKFEEVSKVYSCPEGAKVPDHMNKLYTTEQVAEIAKEIFGGDQVRIVSDRLYIRFPKLEITNSYLEKHNIYDLIVKVSTFPSPVGGIRVRSFEGMRLALTVDEVDCGYSHSHLPMGTFSKFTEFCTGSSDFRICIENISLMPSITNWEIFLMSIKPFVSWESREGGPHIRMENIGKATSTYNENNSQVILDIDKLTGTLPVECVDFDKFDIIPGNSFDNFLNNNASVGRSAKREHTKEEISVAYGKLTQHGTKIKWNGDKTIDFRIVTEDVENSEVTIKDDIKKLYLLRFNDRMKKFYKKYKHEQNKKRRPIPYYYIRKAKDSNHRETAKADRLPS